MAGQDHGALLDVRLFVRRRRVACVVVDDDWGGRSLRRWARSALSGPRPGAHNGPLRDQVAGSGPRGIVAPGSRGAGLDVVYRGRRSIATVPNAHVDFLVVVVIAHLDPVTRVDVWGSGGLRVLLTSSVQV